MVQNPEYSHQSVPVTGTYFEKEITLALSEKLFSPVRPGRPRTLAGPGAVTGPVEMGHRTLGFAGPTIPVKIAGRKTLAPALRPRNLTGRWPVSACCTEPSRIPFSGREPPITYSAGKLPLRRPCSRCSGRRRNSGSTHCPRCDNSLQQHLYRYRCRSSRRFVSGSGLRLSIRSTAGHSGPGSL